jgi:hypothetical protein
MKEPCPSIQDASDRGIHIMIFQAQTGAPPDTDEGSHHLFNKKSIDATCARIVDTLQQFPMADGFVLDGPEWGYEISEWQHDVCFTGFAQIARLGPAF